MILFLDFLDFEKQQLKKLTLIAIFLNLFMAENCFRRDRTAESRGLSGASPPTCIHGWPVQTYYNCRCHSLQFRWHLK
ncbi:hypothetical protein ACJIZ3_021710 [Penstemon smallii]|uniref:Uncharacterized protein n=1 Tax=Penstemon smallii TaxID=265156 RepID=A0ABD3SM72_9LAMI